MLKKLSIIAAAVALAGCATHPATYSESRSHAMNLAEAGRIDGLRDQEIPADQYDKITDGSLVLDAAWTWSNYTSPGIFSSDLALGLSLATILFSNSPAGQSHQMVAWMPSDMADDREEAAYKMAKITDQAINNAFDELGIETKKGTHKAISRIHTFIHIVSSRWACKYDEDSDSECTLHAATIKKPKVDYPLPEFLGVGSSYFFSGGDGYRNEITIAGGENAEPDVMLVYSMISKHLPKWAFLYVPPARNMRPRRDFNVPMPVVYHQGKPHFFLVPEKD